MARLPLSRAPAASAPRSIRSTRADARIASAAAGGRRPTAASALAIAASTSSMVVTVAALVNVASTSGSPNRPSRSSDIEEHGFSGALEDDVEAIPSRTDRRCDQRRPTVTRDVRDDRIPVEIAVVGKIESGDEPLKQSAGEHADHEMGRLGGVAGPRHRAGNYGIDRELAPIAD